MRTWRFIDSGPHPGAANMQMDERLLEQAAAGEVGPTLRFYTWSPPAVSIGRFQRIETSVHADTCKRLGIDIVRRITGGRAVLHNRELTYSIVSPADVPIFPDDVLGTYRVIAEGLLKGLSNLGLRAEMLSRSCRNAQLVKKHVREPACFSSPSWYEIVVNGRKIIGSAQRRTSRAFLQHGSILISYDPILEASVIAGGGKRERVTSIEDELGGKVSIEEVKTAFRLGFSEAFGTHFE